MEVKIRNITLGILSSIVSMGMASSPCAASKTTVFKSTDGFTVSYPATWRRIDDDTRRLQILALKGHRAKGIFIGRGQSMIFVTEGDYEAYDRAKASPVKIDGLISLRFIPKGEAPWCSEAKEVIYRDTIGPARGWGIPAFGDPLGVAIEIDLVCAAHGRVYYISEQHWSGDKNQARWQATAREMLKSFQVHEQGSAKK